MSDLITRTIADLHTGATTWRVMLLLCIPALLAGLIAGLVQMR